jgi:nucleoside-diphosphate-sugar epimerase
LRDYLHVDELVKIIHRSFDKQGTYNIGSGKLKTVLEIAEEFKKPTKFLPARPGEIHSISLDITKAKKDELLNE